MLAQSWNKLPLGLEHKTFEIKRYPGVPGNVQHHAI